jgi:hypothetical protein
MLRLNKKKEEAKQQQEAKAEEKGEEPMEVEGKSGDNSEQAEGEEGAVSVLGIGGKRIQGNAAKKPTKKRTPGEIRIQKGEISL